MKTIVLTGGGTAGHINPNIALIPRLQSKGYEVHYLGQKDGMEQKLVSSIPGVTYHCVRSGKLRRYFSLKNFTDPFKVIAGYFDASKAIKAIRPALVFSKGGFVSVPVCAAGKRRHVPVILHESDYTPGLANKLCRPFARKFATTFPECAAALGSKAEMTGTPLRPELFGGSRAKGLALLGFTGTKPVLLMMGGSLGAQSVNKVLRAALPDLLPSFDLCHICGKGNLAPELEGTPGYKQLEFVDKELPDILATADLVLSRAGSNALCEFQALGKPMLLVPYPKGASRGDQILNAQSLEKRGLCRVLLQENLTRASLTAALNRLWADREQLEEALRKAPPADGTRRVLEMIEEVQQKKHHA